MAHDWPLQKKTRATVLDVIGVDGGMGSVFYLEESGASGTITVTSEGWGAGWPNYWPPRKGDVIEIIAQPNVILKERDGQQI